MGPDTSSGGNGKGNLVISLVSNSGPARSIDAGGELGDEVLAAMRYDLILTGPDGETLNKTVAAGTNQLQMTVALGDWRIDARAYQEDSVLAGTGSVTFTVTPRTTAVTVPMNIEGACYEITINSDMAGVPIRPNFSAAFPGTTITLTVTPGYVLRDGSLAYSYVENDVPHEGNLSGPSYSFSMSAADVTIRGDLLNTDPVRDGGSGDGASWETASSDLQKMMDELSWLHDAGTYTGPFVVKVAAGTYYPQYAPGKDGNSMADAELEDYDYDGDDDYDSGLWSYDKTFILREGVEIRGGYSASGEDITESDRKARFNADGTVKDTAHKAVLSGDIDNNDSSDGTINGDNAYHVVLGVDIPADGKTVLDGLTITGGNAGGVGSGPSIPVGGKRIYQKCGGGIYNVHSSPTLVNVTIAGNSANNGGGMFNSSSSSPKIGNSIIWGNTATTDPGIYDKDSTPVINSSIVQDESYPTTGTPDNGGNMTVDPEFESLVAASSG
jgi:hypothetical protein